VRYLFAAAGQQYEDFRFDSDAWRTKYKNQSPTGQAPYLEVQIEGLNKTIICQSIAICN
jgi:glutathione S-transferase